MDLFNKVHTFESMISLIYEPNISPISLMFHYAKPRLLQMDLDLMFYIYLCFVNVDYYINYAYSR